ncbi:MAG: hypothetical protein WA213_18705 [Terriglobales bacterium]
MAVSALAVAVIESSFRASLVSVVGAAALPSPSLGAAGIAAVTLSPVAVPADPEDRVASDRRTNPLTKNDLAMPIHVRPEAGLDNGKRSWQVKTSLLCGYLLKVARLDARAAPTVRAPDVLPPSTKNFIRQVDD